jgi:hypothetical protein
MWLSTLKLKPKFYFFIYRVVQKALHAWMPRSYSQINFIV